MFSHLIFLSVSQPITISSNSRCALVKGHFGVEITVDTGMAPIAQMLIYAILPDGEVIADAAKFDIEKCFPNKVSDLFPNIFQF